MICALLMLWMASQAVSAEAVQHMQAGIEADKQEHFEVAIAEFRKATELAPNLAEAFVGLGRAYMENHEYGAALAPLKRAVELNPDLLVAHEFLGYVLLAQGYAAEAIPHLERAGARDALGIAQVDAGQLAEAVVRRSMRGNWRKRSSICAKPWLSVRMIRICCTTWVAPAVCCRSSPSISCWP